MRSRTVARAYDSLDDALHVVRALEAAGIAHGQISVVGTHAEDLSHHGLGPATETGVSAGATVGTLLGGGVGLLAGLGALAIPGVGPLIAAGWLVATLAGAGVGAAAGTAAGGLLGSLAELGVTEEDAHVYAEGLRRGGALVTVRTDEDDAPRVESLLMHRAPVDPATRRLEYSATGWAGVFEPPATEPALPAEPLALGDGAWSGEAGAADVRQIADRALSQPAPNFGMPDTQDAEVTPPRPPGSP